MVPVSVSAVAVSSAPGSSVHAAETLLFFVLLQLLIIVSAGRIGALVAYRFKQSAAVGEIIVGILLGPSLFGLLFPDTFNWVFHSAMSQPMYILSQIGLILLMFQIGMEFDFSHLQEKNNRQLVTRIALAGMGVPFLLGFSLGYYASAILSPGVNGYASGLFIGTAFSITALPILGRIMMELDITREPIGVIAISAAAMNDVAGWLLLAAVTSITVSQFDTWVFSLRIIATLGFMTILWFGVRPLLKHAVRHLTFNLNGEAKEGSQRLNGNVLALLLSCIFIAAMCTYQIGIFAIFGAFMLGVLLHDEHELRDAWQNRMGQFVNVFFLPIFFTYTGLRTNIGGLNSFALWGWCCLIIALATLGKYGATYGVARLSGLNRHAAGALGVMMNTRALMELIVINIGFDLGVISKNVFTMLVIMAIFSTIITTPILKFHLSKILQR